MSSLNYSQVNLVGNSQNFSQSQLNEIARKVDRDAASLVFALVAKGFELDPLKQVYDNEDEEYRKEYGQ